MSDYPLLLGLHAILAILLCIAVVTDLRSRVIDNWLNAIIALLALLMWIAVGMAPWPDMAIQAGIALAVFGFFTIMFALNLMGGGDVKLLAALALWFPIGLLMKLLIHMSIIGFVLTLGYWIYHKRSKADGRAEVPYGVAIAIAGLWSIYERYLNHFA
jgi:prepilin peptidase CpaA